MSCISRWSHITTTISKAFSEVICYFTGRTSFQNKGHLISAGLTWNNYFIIRTKAFYYRIFYIQQCTLPLSVVNDAVTSFSRKELYSRPFLQVYIHTQSPVLFSCPELFLKSFGAFCARVLPIAAIRERNNNNNKHVQLAQSLARYWGLGLSCVGRELTASEYLGRLFPPLRTVLPFGSFSFQVPMKSFEAASSRIGSPRLCVRWEFWFGPVAPRVMKSSLQLYQKVKGCVEFAIKELLMHAATTAAFQILFFIHWQRKLQQGMKSIVASKRISCCPVQALLFHTPVLNCFTSSFHAQRTQRTDYIQKWFLSTGNPWLSFSTFMEHRMVLAAVMHCMIIHKSFWSLENYL